jgi:predicted nucleotidyltransferase
MIVMLDALKKHRLTRVVNDKAAAHLRAFRRSAERALPGQVAGVILFGSRARGEARRDSDYDVAVLIQGLDDRRPIDHLLSDIAYPHILAGFHIRPVAVSIRLIEQSGRSSFAMSLIRDGVAV